MGCGEQVWAKNPVVSTCGYVPETEMMGREKPTVWGGRCQTWTGGWDRSAGGCRPRAQPSLWGPNEVILTENTYQRRRKLYGHLQCDTHMLGAYYLDRNALYPF